MSESFGRISGVSRLPDRVTMAWLLASLTLAIGPHVPRLPAWLPLLFLAAVAERMSHFYFKRRPLATWLRLAITVVCLAAILKYYGTILGRQAGVALLCAMLALKLMETFRRRDVYLLISLAYFVVVTQFLFEQSIYMVGYLLLAVVVITGTLIVTELQPSRERHGEPGVVAAPFWGALRNAAWMLLQGLPLMAAMFLLFPRLGTPLWGVPEDALAGKTGISDRMEPGKILELFIDDSVAFRVEFEGPVPDPNALYWRGPVLWYFNGNAWCRDNCIITSTRPPLIGVRSDIDPSRIRAPIRYQVTLEPTDQHWLFALDLPVRRTLPPRSAIEFDFTLHRRAPVSQLLAYEMISDPLYPMDGRWDRALISRGRQLPAGSNPRARELASDWARRFGANRAAIVQRALTMFRNEGFSYSFQPPPIGIHGVDDFLFETKDGYCEYYASAFTFLMRAAGVSARVVTGYQGGTYNANAGYLLVRQSDAHAWAEVWLDDRGWVRVDPTAAVAPDRVNLGALAAVGARRGLLDFAWLREVRDQFDAVHRLWSEWVLKFDRARQRSLFKPLGIEELSARNGMLLLVAVGTLFVGLVMYLLLRAQWLGGYDPVAREYARFCRKMARLGIQRKAWEGPRDFARRAAAEARPLAPAIEAITDLYVDLRYASGAPAGALEKLQSKVRRLRG